MDWNRNLRLKQVDMFVVPYIGTWIETPIRSIVPKRAVRRTLYRYVDWNNKIRNMMMPSVCRTLYRYVDWNIFVWIGNIIGISRTLYRYVDWNSIISRNKIHVIRRTLYRYVDWNASTYGGSDGTTVVPYIGTWIETCLHDSASSQGIVVPYIGTWIETGHEVTVVNTAMSYLI